MQVFISWSKSTSQKIAEALHEWLPLVIQSVKPYTSSSDIETGAQWRQEIANQLSQSHFGILCITRENTAEPWLLFEAGALSNAVTGARVVPLFFDLKPTDIAGPLTAFQSAECTKEGIWKLVHSLHDAASEKLLDELQTRKLFDNLWPNLEAQLTSIREDAFRHTTPTEQPGRPAREVLDEILQTVRDLQRVVTQPAQIPPNRFLPSEAQVVRDTFGLDAEEVAYVNRVIEKLDGFPDMERARHVARLFISGLSPSLVVKILGHLPEGDKITLAEALTSALYESVPPSAMSKTQRARSRWLMDDLLNIFEASGIYYDAETRNLSIATPPETDYTTTQ